MILTILAYGVLVCFAGVMLWALREQRQEGQLPRDASRRELDAALEAVVSEALRRRKTELERQIEALRDIVPQGYELVIVYDARGAGPPTTHVAMREKEAIR